MKSLTAIILLFTLFSTAQKQNNQWRFGYGGSIDFNNVPPSGAAGGTPAIATGSGCASVAHPVTGELLFYTDGRTLWNRNNQPMPNGNGLYGPNGAFSTTAAIIVPKPFNPTLYYIFTIPSHLSTLGFYYSIVDMTLNGGLGDIVPGEKNISVANSFNSERFTVSPDASGCGYWLVALAGESFFSYHITSAGVSLTPLTSPALNNDNRGLGYVKINQQFDRIAIASRNAQNNEVHLYDFDNASGLVSNPKSIILDDLSTDYLVHGIEFSPDGSKLYASNVTTLLQYDILGGYFGLVASLGDTVGGALQLGPDGKIYGSSAKVFRINKPNLYGSNCELQFRDVIVNPTGAGDFGLPQKVYALTEPVLTILTDGNCQEPAFSLSETKSIVSVSWDFGDPSSGVGNSSSLLNPTHTFSSNGTYTVTAVITYPCRTVTLTKSIIVRPMETPIFNPVASICEGSPLVALPVTSLNGITGTWTPTLNNATTTTYTFTPDPGQCANATTLTIVVDSPVVPEFNLVTTACLNEVPSTLPTISTNGIKGSWLPAVVDTSATTTYAFTPDAGQCATTATHTIVVNPPVQPKFDVSPEICPGQLSEPLPTTSNNGISGVWFPAILSVSEAATYIFTPNAGECALPTSLTTFLSPIDAIDAAVTVSYPFESQNTITVTVTKGEVLGFQLDEGPMQTEPIFENVNPGVHTVKILSSSRCFEDLIIDRVFVIGYLKFFTPNGDGFNDRWTIPGALALDNYNVTIFDRYGKLIKKMNPRDGGWDGTCQGTALPSNDYWFIISFTYKGASHTVRGHFALVR